METRAHHILIGLLTLLGSAALLYFVLWMSRNGIDGEGRQYDILFNEAVSGLSVGSIVRYSGIRVGEVERLWLDEGDPRRVWARVRLAANVPVKTDTTARLTLLNITGASGIELSQGLPQSPLLADGSGIPVIEAETSSLARLRVGSDDLVENITLLLDRANAILSEENAALLHQVLLNIDVVTQVVVDEREDLRAGLQSLASAGAQLNRILVRIEERLADEGDQLMAEASATLNSVRHVSEQLQSLLQDNSPALAEGMQAVGELGPVLQDLRTVLARLNTMTRQLETGPAGVLLGNDDMKEFVP